MLQLKIGEIKRKKDLVANTETQQTLKKMCFQKCKNCKGVRCPNFYGHLGTSQDYKNYNGVLHSKKIRFLEDIENTKIPMDYFDWYLIAFLIFITISLLLFGGFMP